MPEIHDVIIIGAGPCGLAVAARLCEHTPSAIFTDEEHQRYHWIRKHGRKMSLMKGKRGCVVVARPPPDAISGVDDDDVGGDGVLQTADAGGRRTDSPSRRAQEQPAASRCRYKTLVLDASADAWLANWNRLFQRLEISHLRSPMFFHVDPRDRDGLLAYAYERERKDELMEIRDCVGKEVSKHKRKKKQAERMGREKGSGPKAQLEIDERDRKDYYAPSRLLFANHCDCIVNRYGLNSGLVRKETVRDIDFAPVPFISNSDDELFTVTTNAGVHYARAVVAAVGVGNAPMIPDEDKKLKGSACHSNCIGAEFPPPNVAKKIARGERTEVLVVGGGLTSAQLTDLAVRKGVSKVWHIMRSELKVKPFDVNLEWMGKFKNHEKAVFWSADSDEERLAQIRTARNGGSITPAYHRVLKAHVATSRVSLHTHTTLVSRIWDAAAQTWTVATDPPVPGLLATGLDHIFFATGVAPDFSTLPFLQTMLRRFPLHGHGGFPCLSEDLMWRGATAADASEDGVRRSDVALRADEMSKVDGRAAEAVRKRATSATSSGDGSEGDGAAVRDDMAKRVPLFVTGRLASLRLGPGAGNLEGARAGAERIAWALEDVLAESRRRRRRRRKEGELEGDDRGASASLSEAERQSRDAREVEDDDAEDHEEDDCVYRYCAGIGSRFESLSV